MSAVSTTDDATTFFLLDETGAYLPTRLARSAWSEHWLNGPSIVAAQARQLERQHGVKGMVPARLTVDLFSPARFEPFTVVTREVRRSNRIHLADAEVHQGDVVVARATLLQLRRGEQPPGTVWSRDRDEFRIPRAAADESLARGCHRYFVGTPEDPAAWSTDMTRHQNDHRKCIWNHPRDVVAGEEASPFQRAATLGESASLTTNWGTDGIGFINADLTLTLSRLPRSEDLGLMAEDHFSEAGVATGMVTLFDREGAFGSASVVAVSNAGRQIDFSPR